jgi:hypothetical protein
MEMSSPVYSFSRNRVAHGADTPHRWTVPLSTKHLSSFLREFYWP